VLLVQGPWPQAEAVLEVDDPMWTGLGRGHGYLDGRAVTVTSTSRRWPRPRRERLLLPDASGGLAPAPQAMSRVRAMPPVSASPAMSTAEARAAG
jgi:hypothetical protein